MVSIEKGAATVQIGFVFRVLWALGLEGTFSAIDGFGSDRELASLLAAALPDRAGSSRRPSPLFPVNKV